jgi:hypothetical protein
MLLAFIFKCLDLAEEKRNKKYNSKFNVGSCASLWMREAKTFFKDQLLCRRSKLFQDHNFQFKLCTLANL